MLEGLGRPWALVGGLAVSARAEPRFTRDIDLAVAVQSDADAEGLLFSLNHARYGLLTVIEQEAARRLATVRLAPPEAAGVVVDLLFASCGVEPEIVAAAERLEVLEGVIVPVARTGHLIAMKLLAQDDRLRPQDRVDLLHLIAAADAEELGRAREAVTLIQERGFGRSKDLTAALARLLADAP